MLPNFQEKFVTILDNVIQKIEVQEILPNLFHGARITLISKSDKDTIRKENYRPIFIIM